MLRKIFTLLSLPAFVMSLALFAGCSEDAGDEMEDAADAVEDTAEDAADATEDAADDAADEMGY
jgi:TRAP-type C4-dicarboxylate transport system substrate-binding protein